MRTVATPGVLHCGDHASAISKLKTKQIAPSLLSNSSTVIGEGVFGTCKLSMLQGTIVCVKQSKCNSAGSQYSLDLLHEASVLIQLSHSSLCWLMGIQLECKPAQLVMPFYSVGGVKVELYDVLFRKDSEVISQYFTVPSKQPQFWITVLSKIAEGLQHIHSLNLVYRDLKSDNIVFYEAAVPCNN